MTPDEFNEILRPHIAGRRWILTPDVVAGVTGIFDGLRDLGAIEPHFIVAGSYGTGDLSAPERAEVHVFGIEADTIMEGFRRFHQALANPPAELCAAIDRWDPDRTAQRLGFQFDSTDPICGRPTFGGRPASYVVLEDKMLADEIWDAAGIARPPSRIVAAEPDAIRAAARALASDEGAVVVGDNREGWHGGAEYVRWLAPDADWSNAVGFFTHHCDRVRVTPFLAGTPSSIHGMVFDDVVVAFRPAEMLVFRSPGSDRFRYAGLAALWEPPPGGAEAMRDAVRAVGRHLRDRVGYRGAFGIDGVFTESGFLPTELNPRYSVGFGLQGAAAGLSLGHLDRLLRAGVPVDIDPADLEQTVLEAATTKRHARALTVVPGEQLTETETRYLTWAGDRWVVTDDEEGAHATLRRGPAAQGSIVFLALQEGHHIPFGQSFAPYTIAGFALADELWDTGIGPLLPGDA